MKITESQLRLIIREELVGASPAYMSGPEAAMSLTKSALITKLTKLQNLQKLPMLGSEEHFSAITASIVEAGLSPDSSLGTMIFSTLKMIPPKFMISHAQRSNQ